MKRFIWPILLLMGGTPARAQKAFIYNMLQKNGFVSASVGVSQPVGTFARQEGNARCGRALRGSLFSLSAGYRLAGPLGLMVRYEQTTNRIDPQPLTNQYVQTPGDALTATAAAGAAGRWQARSLMVGPFVTIPMGRLAVDVRALAGQTWAICPETQVEGQIGQATARIWADNQEAKAIAAGVGLTARYRLTPTMAIHINSDYSAATFTFRNVPVDAKIGSNARQMTVDTQQTMNAAGVSVGATVQFGARNYVF